MWLFQDDRREKGVAYMEESVKRDGYPLEKFEVTTKDGYINIMYRISHGKDGNSNNICRPAVMLNHGMICSSAMFVNSNCFAFYLADNGFDVWLPNNRGTSFSTKHADFDAEIDKDRYWNFGIHELAIYDTTAFIDFLLEHTGQQKVCLIGFSQGCTIFAIMTAELPEYNKKISLSVFFGCPILFENLSFYPARFNIYLINAIIMVLENIFRMHVHEIPGIRSIRAAMAYAKKNTFTRKVIELLVWSTIGHKDSVQVQELDIPRVSLTGPDSASKLQLLHFGQMLLSGRFAKYDYGTDMNMKLYDSKIPPLYDLSKVTAPVVIFYGKNDMYNNHINNTLKERLGGVVHEHIIDYDYYNHLDFLYAKDNIDLLYSHTLKYMKNYCIDNSKSD